MSTLAKQLIGESAEGPKSETRVYKITSRPQDLDKLEQMFRWMNMTAGGHSGSMLLAIDGDGAARVKVEKEDGELVSPDEEFQPKSSGDPEFKVSLESLNTPKLIIEAFKPVKCWYCPHCRQEIHERHTYMDGEQEFHSDCKGALIRPPYDWSGVDQKWRALLEPKMEYKGFRADELSSGQPIPHGARAVFKTTSQSTAEQTALALRSRYGINVWVDGTVTTGWRVLVHPGDVERASRMVKSV